MDLFIKQKLKRELKKLNISHSNITVIKNKDGVIVARIQTATSSHIIKYFQNDTYKREIKNYKILMALQIPTIKIIDYTDSAILMEDVSQSEVFRLGIEDDLNDIAVVTKIAEWYKHLHTVSKEYVTAYGSALYDETDFITKENIEHIKIKTDTADLPVWKVIDEHFDVIISKIQSLPRTLTYNDFYYTNLIVAKDKSSAFMFDYNLLGKGYIYSDIRNVCSSLGENANQAFLEAYGEFDKQEIIVDEVASVLVTLYHACQRKNFPAWANSTLNELKTDYVKKVEILIDQ